MINENCSSYCKSINVPLIGSVKELEKTKTFGGYILIKKEFSLGTKNREHEYYD